MIDQKV